jgi:hypothetical protein
MTLTATCAKCGKAIKVPAEAAGKKGKCPSCGATIEIPAAGSAAPPASTDPVAALAAALDAAAGAPVERAVPVLEAAPPVASPPEKPAPVKPVPIIPPPKSAAPPAPSPDTDEIAVPPIGVQTPSGLPIRPYGSSLTYQWQRRLAGHVRVVGLVLGGLCFAAGMIIMILMALQSGNLLVPGIGLFIGLLVVGAMTALGGLLLRHVLLLLADLGQGVRALEDLLERMNERLG